jgi:hypothetical protein
MLLRSPTTEPAIPPQFLGCLRFSRHRAKSIRGPDPQETGAWISTEEPQEPESRTEAGWNPRKREGGRHLGSALRKVLDFSFQPGHLAAIRPRVVLPLVVYTSANAHTSHTHTQAWKCTQGHAHMHGSVHIRAHDKNDSMKKEMPAGWGEMNAPVPQPGRCW